MPPVVLIPAFQPGDTLVHTVREVRARSSAPIVVVNDGSALACTPVFDALASVNDVTVLSHVRNLGKGQALRTGMSHVARHHRAPEHVGVVTADADGQHAVDDIVRVARVLDAHPTMLVLGVRRFGRGVPLGNRAGNLLARGLMRAVAGLAVSDTQTGLRGIPLAWIPELLEVGGMRYEFEMAMLLWAASRRLPIREEPIRTIYGAARSHFAPVRDSLRIALATARFILRHQPLPHPAQSNESTVTRYTPPFVVGSRTSK